MKKDNEKKSKKALEKILNIVLILLIILIFIGFVYYIKNQDEINKKIDENTLTYDQLLTEIQNNNIEEIEMTVGSTTLKIKEKGYNTKYTSVYGVNTK